MQSVLARAWHGVRVPSRRLAGRGAGRSRDLWAGAETGAPHDKLKKTYDEREPAMAAMKPRTGDGPMEAVKEGRLIIVRVPLEGGGRLVVSVNDAEAKELYDVLGEVVSA